MSQNRDDIEDEEFELNQVIEGMPTSVVGFKDHPVWVWFEVIFDAFC